MKFHATTGLGLRAVVSCIVAAGLSLAGCVSDGSPPPPKGKITIGARDFPESVLLANMYSAVLEPAGFEVDIKYDCDRKKCLEDLDSGEVDLVPEYLGSLTGFLVVQQYGPDAESPASSDEEETFAIVRSLVERRNLTAYQYSPATSQNAFAVSRATAERYGLTKLSDLAQPSVRGRLVLGGSFECPDQTYCKLGLEKKYGAVFKSFIPLNVGERRIDAVADGSIDIGVVFASDGGGGSWVARGLIELRDDKRLQPAENIFPLIRSDKSSAEIETLLGDVSRALTTDELKKLNRKVGYDNEDASDVAESFLGGKGLLKP
jgi:osmoprotectant transport system substrate-binding protein